MESTCVRHTLIPATSQLFSDFLYQFNNVQQFFPYYFADESAFHAAAAKLQFPEGRRRAMIAALRPTNGSTVALERLAQPGTLAVVTGQQVGLFSGPAYTVFKAITAVRLARQLSESGVPAVPVFWLATEDHDLAEIDHAWVFNENAQPVQVALEDGGNGGPVGRVVPGQWPIAELKRALGDLPFASEVVQRVEAAYRPGVSLGSAFLELLRDLLRDLGLVFIDPLEPAIREISAPFLSEAAHRIPELVTSLRERNEELGAAGYHAQVHVEEDSSLLFVINGKRTPLRWKDGQFVTKERGYAPDELAALGPALSPNALLRPVMQDFLLPTVAYVGGPAEIAYMAQSAVLYDKLLGRMPVIFPRNSMTLLDARASKVLAKYDLSVPDLLDYHEQVRARLARRLVPSELSEQIGAVRATLFDSLNTLDSRLSAFDPTLQAASRKSGSKMMYQLDKLAAKTAREALRRDARAGRDADYVLNLVYPHRHLQERFYSIIPFLAKAGLDLPVRLLNEAQLSCPDHTVRSI